jgi:hypothetical protein
MKFAASLLYPPFAHANRFPEFSLAANTWGMSGFFVYLFLWLAPIALRAVPSPRFPWSWYLAALGFCDLAVLVWAIRLPAHFGSLAGFVISLLWQLSALRKASGFTGRLLALVPVLWMIAAPLLLESPPYRGSSMKLIQPSEALPALAAVAVPFIYALVSAIKYRRNSA